jgi:hypothetical protein
MQAAERRARDEKSCASGALAQQEADQAAKASVETKVIDLTLDDDMNDYIYSDFDQDIIIIDDDSDEGTPRSGRHSSAGSSKGWSCTACTFINLPIASHCEMCDLARPKSKVAIPSRNSDSTPAKNRPSPPSVHWSCWKCTLDNAHESWSCTACGTIKARS